MKKINRREELDVMDHGIRRRSEKGEAERIMGLPGFGPESQAPKARRIPSYPTAPLEDVECKLIKKLTHPPD